MAPTLYLTPLSPPVRAVLITAKAIGLNLTEKEINLFEGEHLKPDYIKLNPLHTVPTLVDDDGFVLYDSQAIMVYIVSKYAKKDALYPKDLKKQALVNQRLHFNSGVLFSRLKRIVKPILLDGKTTVDPADIDAVLESYGNMEVFLNNQNWIAGDSVTIADFSLITTITGLDFFVPIDPSKFPKITAWIERCEALPEYKVNEKGMKMYRDIVKSKLQK